MTTTIEDNTQKSFQRGWHIDRVSIPIKKEFNL